jgi:hypothetical protein
MTWTAPSDAAGHLQFQRLQSSQIQALIETVGVKKSPSMQHP